MLASRVCVCVCVRARQYRLCPASEPLTEACFFKTPLAFVGKQALRWDAKDGVGGTAQYIEGDYVSVGTLPAGSTWAKNPLPRQDVRDTYASFPPKCDEVPECGVDVGPPNASKCLCSGMWGPYNVEVVDRVRIQGLTPRTPSPLHPCTLLTDRCALCVAQVKIPESLPAGEYVLGWRWDCEESNQIWSSCSDVSITK